VLGLGLGLGDKDGKLPPNPTPPPVVIKHIVLEDASGFILLEDGSFIKLES
jgi:hypothetical protein